LPDNFSRAYAPKVKDMFDEKLLDRMNFHEPGQSLDYVLERIGKIEDEISGDLDDPRLDMLYV
jgi:hypothetical protein